MTDVAQQAFDEEAFAVVDPASFGDLPSEQGTEHAFAPKSGDVHELHRYPGECSADGGRGDKIADRLCAEEVHGVRDRIDLFRKPIEGAVHDTEQPRRNSRIQLEGVRGIIHHIPHAEVDLRQRKYRGARFHKFMCRWYGARPSRSYVVGERLLAALSARNERNCRWRVSLRENRKDHEHTGKTT